ncbi:hypothetical protein JG687_00019394 [Phytophthora cactorum]|uniref:Uncharacterized protein n=1 Tax=Phytophthora cactorum TaxID=29920 RepID=A0A8T1TJ26_9STRA|nr:hypothetical protein JG687_00019394 [Phytophthora cactorum]
MLVAHATTGTRTLPLPRECYLSWESICWFLEANYPDEFDYFEEQSAALFRSGWQVAGCYDILEYWIMGVMAVIIPADSQRGRTGIRMFGRGI